RPLTADDENEFVQAWRESRQAWSPWTPATPGSLDGPELFRRELHRVRATAHAGTHLRLAAFDGEERLLGLFALNEIVRGVFQSAYASWQVRAAEMGQGVGTDGVRALLDIGFRDAPGGVGLHRIQANVMPGNGASLRIVEKVGFRREGLARRYLRIAGRWEDHEMFALTAEEWPPG
ncbi:MAG: GNAT family protein, partial [Longimicrobiales bacterium]|nr:GNAT family protein [Longimicrobiales bacterium]